MKNVNMKKEQGEKEETIKSRTKETNWDIEKKEEEET